MATPRDTSPEAFRRQLELLKAAGPEARIRMAIEMSDAIHALFLAGIRRRNPSFDEQQIREAAVRHLYREHARNT